MSDLDRFKQLIDIEEISASTLDDHPGHFTEKWISTSLSVIHADFASRKVTFRFPVLKEYQNPGATLHGGAQSTFFDICTTYNLVMVAEPGFWMTLGTTRTLVVNCLRPAQIGEWLLLESEIVQVGKRMCLLRGTLKREKDGAVVSTCEHTKYNVDAEMKL